MVLRRNRSAAACILGLSALVLSRSASAQEWTRFRGPNGTGMGAAASIPAQFSPAHYNWRVALPGEGHSSPVLWGKRIFVTSAEEEKNKRHLLCLNAADGKILWTRSYDYQPYRRHGFSSAANTTPATDARRVYVLWPTPDAFLVIALTHDGREVWRRDLGKVATQHGAGTSPVVYDGLLLFAAEPDGGEGALFALDCETGKTRWKRDRASKDAPYSVPLIFRPRGGGAAAAQVVFTSTSHGVTGLDLKTGAVVWEVTDLFRARCVGSPILVGDLIFATAGNGGGDRQAVAVRPSAGGDKAEVAYRMPRGASYVPTPIAVGEHIFLWGDGGIVTCVKAATGETVWQERVGGNYLGSPVCAGGKLWAMNTRGELVVIEAAGVFKLVARNDLGEPSHATPAIAGGVMYLRTRSHLISLGGKAKTKAAATRP